MAPYLSLARPARCARGRRLAAALLGMLAVLAGSAAPGRAASLFFIRGGGDGHGIGMSQYGAYGYALHGASYQFILGHYYQGTQLAGTDPNRIVRVLLATGHATFSGASAAGHTALKPTQTYTVTLRSDGRLTIVGAGRKQVGPAFAAPLTVTGPGPLTVPGQGSYDGSLQFSPDGQGGVQTVDAVGLDDYVRGVVAAEMPSGWAPAALEAQAVAARTYAITTTVGAGSYDLYDDTRSQMYGGVGAQTPATDAAVAATRGQIVTYDGQPVVTYFFASSGGYTENIQDVWPGAAAEPWLRGVPDPYDAAGGDPYHQWGLQLSLGAAAVKLGGLLKGRLVGITVTRHGVSPRIVSAVVQGTRGSTTVSGGALQSAFGLLDTYAVFTTITTTATPTAVTGSIVPARRGATVYVQTLHAGRWTTVGRGTLPASGRYTVAVTGAGPYRVQYNHLNGPAASVAATNARRLRAAARAQLRALLALRGGAGPTLATGSLRRYAWPLAGHRRPLRPLPLLLRASGLDHRRS